MEGLGEFLRRGREKAGLTLEQLAQRTRIRVENLESLEKGDLESLPSDAYVRGFVRQVCREVGLPATAAIVRYDVLRAQSAPPDEMTWAEERAEESPGRLERALEDPERVVRIARRGGRWVGLAIVAAAVLAGVMIGLRGIRGESEMPSGAAEPAAGPTLRSAPDAGPAAGPASPQEPPPAPPPAERAEASGAVQAAAGTVPAPLPSREPARPARARAVPPVEAAPAPAPAEPRTTTPPAPTRPEPLPEAGETVLLELRAVRSVEVSVLLDGTGHPRRAVLGPGETRRWKASDHFVLSASDGGAVRAFVDGRETEPLGPDGREVLRTLRRAPRR
jgi:transcriptional regulator with XRE-family HTH domain